MTTEKKSIETINNITEITQFVVPVKPTEDVMNILDILTANTINIQGFYLQQGTPISALQFITNGNPTGVISALQQNALIAWTTPAFVLELPNTNGSLYNLVRILKTAGIQVLNVYGMASSLTSDSGLVTITVADPDAFRATYLRPTLDKKLKTAVAA